MPHCLEIVIYYEVEVCTPLGSMHTLRIQSKTQFMYAGGLIILHIIKFNMVTPGADAEFGKGGGAITYCVKSGVQSTLVPTGVRGMKLLHFIRAHMH